MVVITGARRSTNGTARKPGVVNAIDRLSLSFGQRLVHGAMGVVAEARQHVRHAADTPRA